METIEYIEAASIKSLSLRVNAINKEEGKRIEKFLPLVVCKNYLIQPVIVRVFSV